MAVEVSWQALRASHRAHHESAARLPEGSPSTQLLLFYAVECGLKAELLRRRKLRHSGELPAELRHHDLRALAKELRLPNLGLRGCRARARDAPGQDGSPPVAIDDLHQAWRYGARLEPGCEREVAAALRRLCERCAEMLGR